MFTIANIEFLENPTIDVQVNSKYLEDPNFIAFFDKDGYELTALEQQYYICQGYPITNYTAGHPGFFQPWISVQHEYLTIDHSCAMYRCNFTGQARDQIENYKSKNLRLGWLLTCAQKYGIDVDIDYCDENFALEVIHLEWDAPNLELIQYHKEQAEKLILNTDWVDAAHRIWALRDQWQNLTGWYAQSHWKAKYFGLERPWY
jgi:hypothetical protein